MGFLELIWNLSIFHLLFGIVWNYIVALPVICILTLLKWDNLGLKALKAAGLYFMIAMFALITTSAFGSKPDLLSVISYSTFGCGLLFCSYASNLKDAWQQRRENSLSLPLGRLQAEAEIERDTPFELVMLYGQVLVYIAVLVYPSMIRNGLTVFLFEKFNWVLEVPVLPWILGGWGLLTVAGLFVNGLFGAIVISSIVFGKSAHVESNKDSYEIDADGKEISVLVE